MVQAGGMPPAMFGLSGKPLSGRYLSLAEREEIALLRGQGYSIQEIARRLGRAASTISRELRRNAAHTKWRLGVSCDDGAVACRAIRSSPEADEACAQLSIAHLCGGATGWCCHCSERVSIPGPAVSWKGRRQGRRQDRRWARAWSPEQIARRLLIDFPDDETMRISHEAIYQALFVQGRGVLRRELTACLRTGRVLRIPRARARKRGKGFISPEIMISQRPAEAADRPCRDIGRETSSSDWAARRSALSSNARRGSRCCCIFPAWRGTAARHV